MQIYVKTLTGKTITLDVENSDTIENLKLKIEKILEVPPDDQRIIFNAKELQDNKTMDDCKIKEGCILHIVVRLKGGGNIDEIKDEMDEFFEEDSKKGFFANLFSKKKNDNNIINIEKEENKRKEELLQKMDEIDKRVEKQNKKRDKENQKKIEEKKVKLLEKQKNIERIKQIPVAIFFHKQDIKEGRPSDEEIKKYYYFDEIPNNVNYKIFKTSSTTGEGIDEGLNWLLDNIK